MPPSLVPELRVALRLHPAHWRVAYPSRQVNNVYFDTLDYRNLSANLAGYAERAKLRLRWYGSDLACVDGANLELKRKSGRIGWKEIYAVDLSVDLAGGRWSELRRQLRAAIAGRGQVWLDRFGMPTLVNHYRRAYYETPDGTVRLTLDTDLRAYTQPSAIEPNLTVPSPIAETAVLELKAAREYAARLSTILASFAHRVDRFSKYVQGMVVAGGPF